VNRAQIIDMAIAMKEDFAPSAGERASTAYGKHRELIETVAAARWEDSNLGESDAHAIAAAGTEFLNARVIDLMVMLRSEADRDPSSRVGHAVGAHRAVVDGLASASWESHEPTKDELDALDAALSAHMMDVAAALRQLPEGSASPVFDEARRANWVPLRNLAARNWSNAIPADEIAALRAVMRAYELQQ
jgi:hypothetical protein